MARFLMQFFLRPLRNSSLRPLRETYVHLLRTKGVDECVGVKQSIHCTW